MKQEHHLFWWRCWWPTSFQVDNRLILPFCYLTASLLLTTSSVKAETQLINEKGHFLFHGNSFFEQNNCLDSCVCFEMPAWFVRSWIYPQQEPSCSPTEKTENMPKDDSIEGIKKVFDVKDTDTFGKIHLVLGVTVVSFENHRYKQDEVSKKV